MSWCMKVGDIIRRKASDGAPIGPYMQIQVIKDDRVYADVIGTDEPNILILKKNVHVCSIFTLTVSEPMLMDLAKGRKWVVSHPATKHWLSFLNKNYELVCFRTAWREYRHVFVVLSKTKMLSCGEMCVKIVVDQKVI